MKKNILKRIKWENVFALVGYIFTASALIHHIKINGFYELLFLELAMDLTVVHIIKFYIEDKRLKNWK